MRNVADIFGKRLKSSRALTMYLRSPGGDRIETLPAGKPSPVIDSYITPGGQGYFQLLKDGQNLYVKDTPDIEIVDPGAQDNSGALSGITSGLSDWFTNTKKAATKQAGFLSEGFDKATGDLTADFDSFTEQIKPVLYIVAGIIVLLIIKDITD